MSQADLVKRVHIFRSNNAKSQFILLSAPNNVPEESSTRSRDSLLQYGKHPEKLVNMFSSKLTGSHQLQHQNYAQRVSFPRSGIDNMSPDSGFSRRTIFMMSMSSKCRDFWTLRTLCFWGKEHTEEIQPRELHRKKATVWCALYDNIGKVQLL